VDLSVAPLARLALGLGHRQARNGRSLASCRLSCVRRTSPRCRSPADFLFLSLPSFLSSTPPYTLGVFWPVRGLPAGFACYGDFTVRSQKLFSRPFRNCSCTIYSPGLRKNLAAAAFVAVCRFNPSKFQALMVDRPTANRTSSRARLTPITRSPLFRAPAISKMR
jgi:hypothetical protein